MLLFNAPAWVLSPQMNMDSINVNNNEALYEAFKACQDKYVMDNDTHKDSLYFPVGSTVVLQCEGGRPWTHWVIKKANNSHHYGRSYIIRDKNGQTDNVEHKTHMQHPSNDRQVPPKQIKKELDN